MHGKIKLGNCSHLLSEFTGNHNAHLTVMENGEHWFHTEEQLAFLNAWMKKVIG